MCDQEKRDLVNILKMANENRNASEISWLSIVNSHILGHSLLLTATSILLSVGKINVCGYIAVLFLCGLGLFLTRQMRLAFSIARGKIFFWDQMKLVFEKKAHPDKSLHIFAAEDCFMNQGKLCDSAPIQLQRKTSWKIIDAIEKRDTDFHKRLKTYPIVFKWAYFALTIFTVSQAWPIVTK